jgi:SNF2 family DNA or RNA helicase
MAKEQHKTYKKFEEDYVAYIEGNVVEAKTAATLQIKLNQILCGHFYNDEGKVYHFKDNQKIVMLKEIIEEIADRHKILIWATFVPAIELIIRELTEYNPATMYGQTTDRAAEVEKFKKDPSCRVMVLNPSVGGVGLNLIEADYAIFYNKSFSLEEWLQAPKRNRRKGSEIHRRITYIELIYKNTLDEIVAKKLKEKAKMAKELVGGRDISRDLLDPNLFRYEELDNFE